MILFYNPLTLNGDYKNAIRQHMPNDSYLLFPKCQGFAEGNRPQKCVGKFS